MKFIRTEEYGLINLDKICRIEKYYDSHIYLYPYLSLENVNDTSFGDVIMLEYSFEELRDKKFEELLRLLDYADLRENKSENPVHARTPEEKKRITENLKYL